jgi:hypothetical protein
MWKKQRKPLLPTKWSEDLWNSIVGSPALRVIVDGYRLEAKMSDYTRVLGEPGRASRLTDLIDGEDDESGVSDEHGARGSRSKSYITREYFGRLGHLGASNPASDMRVRLSWETARQWVGAHEWWHWGTAIVPRKGVYGYVNPVEYDQIYATPVSLHVKLGTDEAGEAFFEQLFLRSKMTGSDPPDH